MENLIKKYTDLGIDVDKIITTTQPSIVTWSKSRKCLIGGDTGIESLELIDDGNGNMRISYENNVMVSLQIRTELSADEINNINNSAGIICTDALYGKEGFRYGYVPT